MLDRPIAPSFVVIGTTTKGHSFRPSDWADRLCGVMSPYRPPIRHQSNRLGYSPYVMPGLRGDLRCVTVDGRLNQLEPMAYQFIVGFARDNDLVVEGLDPDGAPSS